MERANKRIEEARKHADMPIWVLADLLGVSETTMYRRLRHELPEEEQNRIISAIEKWKGEKS